MSQSGKVYTQNINTLFIFIITSWRNRLDIIPRWMISLTTESLEISFDVNLNICGKNNPVADDLRRHGMWH